MEPFFIKKYNTLYNNRQGYNMTCGGENNPSKLIKNKNRMKLHNPIHILMNDQEKFKLWKEKLRGKRNILSEEIRQNISASKMGSKNPNFNKSETADRLQRYVGCIACHKITNKGNFMRWHNH